MKKKTKRTKKEIREGYQIDSLGNKVDRFNTDDYAQAVHDEGNNR